MIDIGKYSTFQTSNLCENFLDINTELDIEKLIKISDQDFICVGGGSNILLSKEVYENTTFIRNSFKGISDLGDNRFSVKAGENMTFFVNYLNKNFDINKFNPLFGLPGTVGGAVVGNAGCFGLEIGNYVEKVRYIENGNIVESSDYEFSYRNSNLKNRKIILLDIVLYIPHTDDHIESAIYYNNWRKQHQEYGKTCGSYYRNGKLKVENGKLYSAGKQVSADIIENIQKFDTDGKILPDNFLEKKEITVPAGWMIDRLGMKGFEYNGVMVSSKHANFILNFNNKDPQNILKLSEIIKEKVYDKFGIELKEEVVII